MNKQTNEIVASKNRSNNIIIIINNNDNTSFSVTFLTNHTLNEPEILSEMCSD